jgi:Flp pilus assembly pilin Flp
VQFESPLLDLLLPVTLLALTSMLIGLWVSAFANSTDVALPALVLITVVQVVLSGAVPLRFDEIAETLGLIDPSYWAMNMMAGTVDLNALVGYVDDDVVSSWEQAQSTWQESLYALSAYGTLLAVALIGAARHLKKGN